jgi:hypothetical protein
MQNGGFKYPFYYAVFLRRIDPDTTVIARKHTFFKVPRGVDSWFFGRDVNEPGCLDFCGKPPHHGTSLHTIKKEFRVSLKQFFRIQ